jgi:hypothetical protein
MYIARIFGEIALGFTLLVGAAACHGARLETPNGFGTWAETLDAKLRDRGYVADGTRGVKTSKGLRGTQLRYTTTKDGREHRYWVTVFATAKKVFLVEAAGDKEPFDKAVASVDRAIASLDATD